MVDKENHQ